MQGEIVEDRKPPVAAPVALCGRRVHEACGSGVTVFAARQAACHDGPVFWVVHGHRQLRLLPESLPIGLHRRLHLVEVDSEDDLLWATEEALRAKPVALVIAEPEKPLSLTTGRRLQLAAEAGGTTGLMLVRSGHGSNAAETRWTCTPVAATSGGASTRQHWSLTKNKKGTLGDWIVDWDGKAAACHMVPEAGE